MLDCSPFRFMYANDVTFAWVRKYSANVASHLNLNMIVYRQFIIIYGRIITVNCRHCMHTIHMLVNWNHTQAYRAIQNLPASFQKDNELF